MRAYSNSQPLIGGLGMLFLQRLFLFYLWLSLGLISRPRKTLPAPKKSSPRRPLTPLLKLAPTEQPRRGRIYAFPVRTDVHFMSSCAKKSTLKHAAGG
jgi:hypothetical protein